MRRYDAFFFAVVALDTTLINQCRRCGLLRIQIPDHVDCFFRTLNKMRTKVKTEASAPLLWRAIDCFLVIQNYLGPKNDN